ncbi:inositol polyphosphate-5-phosphatase A isoform 1-T3 [Cochliomyia hominivorax]
MDNTTTVSVYDDIDVLLVTANVGSLFEDPLRLFRPWLAVFLRKVEEVHPKFLALHLQEVGGKTYEKSMEYVQEFIKCLCEAPQMLDFEYIRIYMDEDFKSAEHFTALGNLYFVHNSLKNVKMWNFLTHNWESVEGKNIYTGNIETISSKEKSKFPQHFFPECKWSRKGFMRTRWELNNTVFDLVNIHLFHDASNLAACEEFPSVYCKTRRRALVHTLERFHLDEKNGLAPFFLFGDFNFRCDTGGVIKELTENLTAHRIQSMKSDCTKVHYRNSGGDNILTVGKKEFNHADHQLKFKESWLKKFDRELEPLTEFLIEFPIDFPPSYPYEEDPEMPTDYMSTRCPSWCDRILMSVQAKKIIRETESPNTYNLMGEDVCMGDHKPVYLNIRLKSNQGTYNCCRCHLLNANNNKSTSHQIPAEIVTPLCCPFEQKPISDCNNYCPHNSKIYNEILVECRDLNKYITCLSNTNECDKPKDEVESEVVGEHSNEIFKNMGETMTRKWPPVSIKIIDSDNIHVCMCSQISVENNADNDSVDGSICPECQNIIKKQPAEPRYRLISKRLLLSNNIIVNRIDTQHLSTYFDKSQKHQDPYTPESAESHSPCPELSSSTTTSSNSQSPSVNCQQLLENASKKTNLEPLILSDLTIKDIKGNRTCNIDVESAVYSNDDSKKQQRGIVSPGQLKSRLEDLQKKSSIQNFKFKNKGDNNTAGNSDVEDVDDICQSTNAAVQRNSNSCLPKCCNIH